MTARQITLLFLTLVVVTGLWAASVSSAIVVNEVMSNEPG